MVCLVSLFRVEDLSTFDYIYSILIQGGGMGGRRGGERGGGIFHESCTHYHGWGFTLLQLSNNRRDPRAGSCVTTEVHFGLLVLPGKRSYCSFTERRVGGIGSGPQFRWGAGSCEQTTCPQQDHPATVRRPFYFKK